MKKSEYRDQLEVLLGPNDPAIPNLLRLADKLGTEWLPEEPELPERIVPSSTSLVVVDPSMGAGERDLTPEERHEAAACYNLVRRILPPAHLIERGDGVSLLGLYEWLDEEREKLR